MQNLVIRNSLFRHLKTALFAGVSALLLAGCQGGVLDPKGQVGVDEKHLIVVATLLMLIVVVPVIFMTLFFAWKYREGRTQEIYAPKWSHSTKIELVVWIIPIIIVAILGTITWRSTHALDPYKPLVHEKDHIVVEVVSLNWKWLFIYPEQGVASINELAFPTDVPVEFKITSDTTMNSFFIPQLGGQIYSMAGMETQLHLIANEAGTYDGYSANYSGEGFTGMQFKAIATPDEAGFDAWVNKLKQSSDTLSPATYAELAKPSENNPVQYFAHVSSGMFHHILHQFMHGSMPDMQHGEKAVVDAHRQHDMHAMSDEMTMETEK
ncbi:ubiquinol oxidase subunit II [Oceanisphaera profunda]|uniref:Ubiquinol oxidase subunit 2 n=1 Tax=Oceanisphaera profunda TaxID=1416627 RepID=A0A1Y0D650_9GAMM|nr:ubiquinol oxidase subunit II [Oceanisphaera profunda]ART82646.1 ubiquinol oxidase subunit II [Oceanisphaera profunda]